MSVRRLTDADKSQIVDLYRTPGETAATLAEQFGVSNTTIGRILKAGIPVKDYDLLVQQKRRGGDSAAVIPEPTAAIQPALAIQIEIPVVTPEIQADFAPAADRLAADDSSVGTTLPIDAEVLPVQIHIAPSTEPVAERRSRRRSSAPVAMPVSTTVSESDSAQRDLEPEIQPPEIQRYAEPVVSRPQTRTAATAAVAGRCAATGS